MDARPDRRGDQGPGEFFAQLGAGLIDCAERLALFGDDDGGVRLDPAGKEIRQWFLELSGTRGRQLIYAGMGGAVTAPAAITYAEMASWAWVTGRAPTPWQARQLAVMDRVYLAAAGNGGQKRQEQDIGEYCRGKDVDKCRRMFGEGLAQVCSTCPQ